QIQSASGPTSRSIASTSANTRAPQPAATCSTLRRSESHTAVTAASERRAKASRYGWAAAPTPKKAIFNRSLLMRALSFVRGQKVRAVGMLLVKWAAVNEQMALAGWRMTPEQPSQAVQDYLKAIHSLGGATTVVLPKDIAARLDVRAPSVT